MEVSSSKKMYPLDTDLSRVWHLLDRRYTASASLQSDCNQRKRAENCVLARGAHHVSCIECVGVSVAVWRGGGFYLYLHCCTFVGTSLQMSLTAGPHSCWRFLLWGKDGRQRWKCWDSLWGWRGSTESGVNPSEEQIRLDVWEIKARKQIEIIWTLRGGTVMMLLKGSWDWRNQEKA